MITSVTTAVVSFAIQLSERPIHQISAHAMSAGTIYSSCKRASFSRRQTMRRDFCPAGLSEASARSSGSAPHSSDLPIHSLIRIRIMPWRGPLRAGTPRSGGPHAEREVKQPRSASVSTSRQFACFLSEYDGSSVDERKFFNFSHFRPTIGLPARKNVTIRSPVAGAVTHGSAADKTKRNQSFGMS